MERCEMCEAPTPRLYETVYRHPDAASERGFFWHCSLTCGACGDECAPEAEPFYRGHSVRALLVGHAIEDMPEHWDTTDLTFWTLTGDPNDTARVQPSPSLWTEDRWTVDSDDGFRMMLRLARCLRFWMTHDPQSYDPASARSAVGDRRPEPLTPAELCEVLGIVEPEQVVVVEKLATSRWYEPRTGTDWWREEKRVTLDLGLAIDPVRGQVTFRADRGPAPPRWIARPCSNLSVWPGEE